MLPRSLVAFSSLSLAIVSLALLAGGAKGLAAKEACCLLWSAPLPASGDLAFLVVVDWVSSLFLGTVAAVASAVLLFSCSYMRGEKFFLRFHLLVASFVVSMALLILSPNLISLLLGWDGLGVTSFLLVIYFQSAKSYNAGMLTVLSNRVGDLFILLAIGLHLEQGGWNLFTQTWESGGSPLAPILVLVIWAAFTKSAQIPFSAWLPAAMAAPTPVSSLVHSSTLVTAGVYLLVRLGDALLAANLAIILLGVGSATMLMAGASAIFEVDMKKIVALSTLSQLGLMVAALGFGAWEVAFIHLLAHAFFKALLFMAVGNMIHMADDFQDMRKASLTSTSSITLVFSGLANASLCGMPFLTGFYSKDWILEGSLGEVGSSFLTAVFFLATLLTAAYSLRFTMLCWLAPSRQPQLTWESDQDPLIAGCCSVLGPLALLAGSVLVAHSQLQTVPLLSPQMKNLTLSVVGGGGLLAVALQVRYPGFTQPLGRWSWGMMWSLPVLSAPSPLLFSLPLSRLLRQFDLGWVATGPTTPLVGASPSPQEFNYSKGLTFMALPLTLTSLILISWVYLVALPVWSPKS